MTNKIKYKYIVYTFLFLILHVNSNAQDALTVTYNCSTGCVDLTINGGYAPYEVEWQYTRKGINWTTVSTKSNLNGNDGQEDYCSPVYGTYKAVVHDDLCGIAEVTILVDPCTCITIEEISHKNVSQCGGNDPDVYPPPPSWESCDGMLSVAVTGTNNYTINWSNGAQTPSISDLCTGTYTVSVTTGGCTKEKRFEICCCRPESSYTPTNKCGGTGAGQLSIDDYFLSAPSAPNANDGSIEITVSGGGQVNYKWTGPNEYKSNDEDIFRLNVGMYCVTISNGCGQSINKCFELKDCTNSTLSLSGSVINTCRDYSYGSINLTVNGGTPPYKFKWSNGKNSYRIENLNAGQYCVTVSDNYGCKVSGCFTVGFNELVTSRNGCIFITKCNGTIVDSEDIGSYTVTDLSDCRYKKEYCNDGYYLGPIFVGTYRDYDDFNCIAYDKCKTNNEVYRTYFGKYIYDEFFGIRFDNFNDCWWCHYVDYCYIKEIDHLPKSSISLQSKFAQSQIHNSKLCSTNEKSVCLQRLWCDGEVFKEWCDPECDDIEAPCTIDDLPIKYEIITEKRVTVDNYEEIFKTFKVTSFDTIAVSNFIREKILNKKTKENIEVEISELTPKYTQINILPNPTIDFVRLEIIKNEASYDNLTILLFDLVGKRLRQAHKEITSNSEVYILSLSDFVPGTYKLIIINKNGKLVKEATVIKY